MLGLRYRRRRDLLDDTAPNTNGGLNGLLFYTEPFLDDDP